MLSKEVLNKEPSFSVLIANYNNANYIHEAIQSVLKQDYKNWEIVIVDDASTDNSLEAIRPYLVDENIRLFVNDSNFGCGFTKKRCIEEAKGELCAYLDPDDALERNALKEMADAFNRFPDSGLIYSKFYCCDENLKIEYIHPGSKAIPNNGPYIFYNDGSISHFAVFRRDSYLQTEGLSSKYTKAVDQNLYLLLDQTGPMRFLDKVLYYYRIHTGGISTFTNVIPAAAQYFKILIEFTQKAIARTSKAEDVKKLKAVNYRSKFHLARLQRLWLKAFYYLVVYTRNGGAKETNEILQRYFRHFKKDSLNEF